MAYVITLTNGATLTTIQDWTVDTTTSLNLLGRGVPNYGPVMAENLVHILENYASTTAPPSPLAGQTFFNNTSKKLRVYDGTAWHSLVSEDSATNQTITISGDATGTGTSSIVLSITPPAGLAGGGTFEKITFNNKGQVTGGSNLTSSDIATAINGLLHINGTISSTNFTLNSGGGGIITFADGTTQSSAATSLSFTPVQQGGGANQSNNKIYIGWNNGLHVQVDDTDEGFAYLSSSWPTITLPAISTANIGGRTTFKGALLPAGTFSNVAYGASTGEDIILEAWGQQDVGNVLRLYRSNFPLPAILTFNVDTGVISCKNVVTSAYDVNATFASQNTRINGCLQSFFNIAEIGGWDGTFAHMTSYINIFAKNALVAPTVLCQTSSGIASAAEYSDLAERYESDRPYPFGTLVKIDGEKEITQTTTQFDFDVFGVISENPAYLMNSKAGSIDTDHKDLTSPSTGNDQTHPPVGLIGRLRVRTVGLVAKGDSLVSSEIPGVAMSIGRFKGDINQRQCIIGKALESKTSTEEDLILAYIGR